MNFFILEDDSHRVKFFINKLGATSCDIYQTAVEAINALIKTKYDVIFLDNDLGINAGEGVDVANFLATNDHKNNSTCVVVHSWNTPAAMLISSLLPRAYLFPYNSKNFIKFIENLT